MKKLLLSISILATSFAFAQEALNETFESYTIGDIGTDITGMTPGQGMWLTTSTNGTAPTTTTNAGNSNFQIVASGGANGQVLQITGPNGDKGTRYMTLPGLPGFWASRTAGNDIIEIEYDFFTGAATSSANNMRALIYDLTGTKIVAGLSFVMSTKVISGVAYYDNTAGGGAVGNYLFNLGTAAAPSIELPANTWVRIGMSFNYATGQVRWKGPGFNGFVQGAATGENPDEAAIVATSGTGGTVVNSLAGVGLFDNIEIRASNADTLLDIHAPVAVSMFSVYPNPAHNVINIANATNLTSVQFTDINGRVVKNVAYDGVSETSIDLSDMASGMYIMTIDNDGMQTQKKIIKN